jgi:hypothetical protein
LLALLIQFLFSGKTKFKIFIYSFSKLFENPLLFLFLALHFHHSLFGGKSIGGKTIGGKCYKLFIHLDSFDIYGVAWCEADPYFCQCPSFLNLVMYQSLVKDFQIYNCNLKTN